MVVVGGSIPLVPTSIQPCKAGFFFARIALTMITIRLPNGQHQAIDSPVSVQEIARGISQSLAKAAIAALVNGQLVDMSTLITSDCNLVILTEKDPQSLEVIRHSAAHLLAQAVKTLFPSAQVTIGPVIEDGFYYDFSFERPFTPEDLEKIESKMHELVSANLPVTRRELPRNEAIAYFMGLGETYKAKIIESIPENEVLSLYRQGDFEDLCRGPHVPRTGVLKAFKLMKVAGAYWRGDANNEMLQRIYGTAWTDKKALADYLFRIEEAEKRDHRRIGKAQQLFHFQDLAPGMVFWHPKGWTIYRILENYMRERLMEYGYQEVRTPQLVDKILWEKSGHWENFRDNMFVTETENREYAVKPMNCPCHVQIYNQGLRSYRELPLRLAEFGNCHRCESSGSLHGLMRVRNFVQDDAHIFCTEDQIQSEVTQLLALVQSVYRDFGFEKITYRLARRPEKRVGSDAVWDKAEQALEDAMRAWAIEWIDAPGEGAFYGPKIECSLADSLGRIWQCGTVQIDFSMPARLEAQYIAEDGSKQTPVMIHRAILGTFERFMGILIEHCAGKWPVWLSPTQIVVLTISEKQHEYATKIDAILQKAGMRSSLDLRNEKIGFKIREHTLQKVPYLLIIGDKEVEQNLVTLRLCDGSDLGQKTIDEVCDILRADVDNRGRIQTTGGNDH
jgi:threonyl-tRNA synthetase